MCSLNLSVAISWLGAYIIHNFFIMVNTQDTFPKPYSIFLILWNCIFLLQVPIGAEIKQLKEHKTNILILKHRHSWWISDKTGWKHLQ